MIICANVENVEYLCTYAEIASMTKGAAQLWVDHGHDAASDTYSTRVMAGTQDEVLYRQMRSLRDVMKRRGGGYRQMRSVRDVMKRRGGG